MGHGPGNQTEAIISARSAREQRGRESADRRGPETVRDRLPAGRLFPGRRMPCDLSDGAVAGPVRIAPRRREEEKPPGLAARYSGRRSVLKHDPEKACPALDAGCVAVLPRDKRESVCAEIVLNQR